MNKESRTIKKKRLRPDRLRKKKEKMKTKRQIFNNYKRPKRLRLLRLQLRELRVSGELRQKRSSTKSMPKRILNTMRS